MRLPSNRKFGFFFTFIFAFIGLYFFNGEEMISSYVFLSLSLTLALVTLKKSEILLPLNKCWFKLGLLLGAITGPIVLGVFFFGIFTPIGLLMKFFRRDELRLRLIERTTHWKLIDNERLDAHVFENQF